MKYIIYHQVKKGVDCPDGVMAAAICALAHPGAELIGDWYNSDRTLFNVITPRTEIIIVDFSYPAERLKRWESEGAKVTVIDHHAPKFPELEGFSGAILDANECGATLTWKHFFPDQPQPPILAHVRRRDIGADGYYKAPENCRDSKAVTAKLSLNRSQAEDPVAYLQEVLKYGNHEIWEHLERPGEALLKEEERIAGAIAATAVESNLPSPVGVACWKVCIEDPKNDRLVSQIGAAVCQAKGEGTICWIEASGGLNSLRSSGVDVSGYAKALGGGGHHQAAGFPPRVKTLASIQPLERDLPMNLQHLDLGPWEENTDTGEGYRRTCADGCLYSYHSEGWIRFQVVYDANVLADWPETRFVIPKS